MGLGEIAEDAEGCLVQDSRFEETKGANWYLILWAVSCWKSGQTEEKHRLKSGDRRLIHKDLLKAAAEWKANQLPGEMEIQLADHAGYFRPMENPDKVRYPVVYGQKARRVMIYERKIRCNQGPP